MYSIEEKILQKIQPQMRRVLIIDPNPAAARLLADLLRGMSARDIYFEADERRALESCREFDPTLIFVERGGPRLDGESFTRKLRRSTMVARKAPVIMVTGEATATTIKGARDSGVHEFLRKPFTVADLLRRIEAVSGRPRDWIEAVGYVGPDRRRFNSAEYFGPEKRTARSAKDEAELLAQQADQCGRILRAALAQFDADPFQARRSVLEQLNTLKLLAEQVSDPQLAHELDMLETATLREPLQRADLTAPISAVVSRVVREKVRAA